MVDTVIVENETVPTSAISWPAVLAGAFVTGAFSLLLLALGSGIGFSAFNPWSPRTMDSLRGATFAGIFFAATAVIASALGGYITGRLRRLWHGAVHPNEVVFRDTAHGLVTWAVATVATAAVLGSASTNLLGGALKEGARRLAETQTPAGAYPDLTDRVFQYDRAKAPPAGAATPFGRPFEFDRGTADRLVALAAYASVDAGRASEFGEHHRVSNGLGGSPTPTPGHLQSRTMPVQPLTRRAVSQCASRSGRLPRCYWVLSRRVWPLGKVAFSETAG